MAKSERKMKEKLNLNLKKLCSLNRWINLCLLQLAYRSECKLTKCRICVWKAKKGETHKLDWRQISWILGEISFLKGSSNELNA